MECFLITQTNKIFFENVKINSEVLVCPECKNIIITDNYRGETICEQCGLVVSEKEIDIYNCEKNIFSQFEAKQKARTGDPHTLFIPKIHFHTIIKTNEIKDYNFKRIARMDLYSNNNEARNLLTAIRILKRMSSALHIPYSIKKKAMLLYRKAYKKELLKGRSIIGVICACLYFACRKDKLPISFQEIVNEGCIKANLVMNCYRTLLKEFNLKVPPLGPALFVSRYINELQLSVEIEKRVLSVLKNLHFSFINGKEPKSLVAAIIYSIGKKENIKITQKTLAKITGTCEVSIRYKSKEIEKILQEKKI